MPDEMCFQHLLKGVNLESEAGFQLRYHSTTALLTFNGVNQTKDPKIIIG